MDNKLLKIYELLRSISKKLVLVTYVLLLASTVFIVIGVIMRYIFKQPILGDVELIEIAMALLVFSAFAYTQTEKGHIHVLMVLNMLPKKLGLAIFGINGLIVAVASGAITYGFFLQGNYAMQRNLISAMLHIPSYPSYFFAFVCMLLFTLVLLMDAIISLAGIGNKRLAEYVQKDWA